MEMRVTAAALIKPLCLLPSTYLHCVAIRSRLFSGSTRSFRCRPWSYCRVSRSTDMAEKGPSSSAQTAGGTGPRQHGSGGANEGLVFRAVGVPKLKISLVVASGRLNSVHAPSTDFGLWRRKPHLLGSGASATEKSDCCCRRVSASQEAECSDHAQSSDIDPQRCPRQMRRVRM